MAIGKKPPLGQRPASSSEVPEQLIRKLSELLKTTDLAEIEISTEKITVRVKAKEAVYASSQVPSFQTSSSSALPPSTLSRSADTKSDLHIVRSPFVGTFYRSPSPTAATFVEPGQSIAKGQVLCIVEAMKLMNEIESDISGVIEKVFVDNATPVDFNTPLFGIRS